MNIQTFALTQQTIMKKRKEGKKQTYALALFLSGIEKRNASIHWKGIQKLQVPKQKKLGPSN